MNPGTVHYLNVFLGTGAIILQILALVALFVLVFSRRENKYLSFVKNNFLEIGFLVSFSAVLVSLFYSEILNYVPCKHCWIQRMFIFPQTVIFAVAWYKNDKNAFWYSVPLTLIGLVDALYLVFIYYFNPSSLPCDASGVSCVQQLVSVYGGYISIPMLGLTGFASLAILLAVSYFYKKEN